MTLEYKGASITFPAREGAGRAVVNGATVLLQKVDRPCEKTPLVNLENG